MTKLSFLRIAPTIREKIWGWRYLLFQIIFLPHLLPCIRWLFSVPLSTAMLNFLCFCINFCAAIVIFHKFLRLYLKADGKQLLRIAWVSVLFFAVYWLANTALGKIFAAIDPTFANVNDQSVSNLSRENYILMFIGTVFLVPVAEECFHRGLVFRGLYDRSPAAAYICSIAIFSAVHIMNYVGVYDFGTLALCFLQYVPACICLAAAYRLSGSIFAPILIHTAVNAIGMLALR